MNKFQSITRLIIIILIFYINMQDAYVQHSFKNKQSLPSGNIDYNDTSRNNDKLKPIEPLPLPKSLKYNKSQKKESQRFYETLKDKAYENKITRELYDLLIVNATTKKKTEKPQNQRGEKPFTPYAGKVIKSIKIRQLDVFGPTINDTAKKADTRIQAIGNRLHFKTQERIIQNSLLIREGKRVDPLLLSDNERVLRKLPYIEDCRFFIADDKPGDDSVEVVVVTKDRWTKGFDVVIDDVDEGKVELWDKSLFGSGHENQHNIYWDQQEKENIGYEGIYRIKNIAGSFIDGRFNYLDAFSTKRYLLDFRRRYVTPYTKYAGEATFEKTYTEDNIKRTDTIYRDIPVDYNYYDVWLGRSFLLKGLSKGRSERSNIILEGRYLQDHFFERPGVGPQTLYPYHNRTLYLAGLAFSRQSFYETKLVYSFGRTEDIPYGYMVKLTGGIEDNEFYQRNYSALNISAGNYLDKLGYFYGSSYLGGFHCKDALQQGFVGGKINYFSPLMSLKRFKFRHFIKGNYLRGINRFNDEFLGINKKHGINGFSSDTLKGTQKLTINIESVTFSPYYLYGFRFVFFTFADLGWIGPSDKSIFANQMYSGYGIGLRIRNERLVFKTFQIRLAYYPVVPKDGITHTLMFSGEHILNTDNFYSRGPEIHDFD